MTMDNPKILIWAPLIISVAALLVSSLMLLVSGLILMISYRVFRRNVLSEKPLLTGILHPLEEPGWFSLNIELRSRSSYGWAADSLRIIWPPSGRLLTLAAAYTNPHGDPADPILRNPLPIAEATREIPLGLQVNRIGHTHRVTVFVFARSSIWSRTLSMRASLRSIEPIERRIEIPIIRTLPHTPKTVRA
jgi:hypothetical protein